MAENPTVRISQSGNLTSRRLVQVIRKLKENKLLHNWYPTAVIEWFAYFLPSDLWFTEEDAKNLLDRLHMDESEAPRAVHHHRQAKNLLMRFIPGEGFKYKMERGKREGYAQRLLLSKKDPEPERKDVSRHLKQLQTKVTDQQQKAFLEEAIKCLEVGACRAAIIMAWILTYDHLRRWVFKKHLAAFNGEISSRTKKGQPIHDPVVNCEDFPHKESEVIDICYKAKLFDRNRKNLLDQGLQERNGYAHPSSTTASIPIAVGYVAKMLENILLDPHFVI